ncbi:DNA repair exonuclease [Paenibacillus sp. N4]|uniref:metallophosphoesterase family protein n=1 Tax=Paenibacillus vietnamensis TaxID=2590547 RepID=UPI001CD11F0F|nr:DNA repair exonuclease [Paenibacillus vietnamensis]MCA0753690.1 DNA repair exonuclease [Paenibacillus vietnamensis]
MAEPFRFIHAADLHLDSPFRGLARAPERVREQLAESTFAALRRLTEAAFDTEADFIVLAGDLFDAADRSLKAQLMLVREWERLREHGIGVFVIHGNHDPLSGAGAKLKLPDNVHVFGTEQVECRPAYRRSGELAAFVYGISYGSRTVTENLAARYLARPGAPFHIALLHGNVGGHAAHDPYAPCSLEELTHGGKGMDYWALGHIHTRQVLHEYPHAVYAGNIQGRHPREAGPKGCYLVEVSASREVRLTFKPLDQVRWLEAEVGIGELQTEQELFELLAAEAERLAAEHAGGGLMLRCLLTGRGALHQTLSSRTVVRTLLEQLQDIGPAHADWGWIHVYELEVRTGLPIHWAELEREDSFSGELYRLSKRLEADEDLWRSFAESAVGPLASHAKLGKYIGRALDELPGRWLEEARELTLGLVQGTESEERG